jgi:DNA modification methylase
MAKQYKGSLSLDWYNKQKSILLRSEQDTQYNSDVPAPQMDWINKEESLFYEINTDAGKGVKPFWVDRNDIRLKEARPLLFQRAFRAVLKDKNESLPGMDQEYILEELADDTGEIENMVIKGDNLLALNTLKKHFENKNQEDKIKCIYIDPPYNTQSAFVNYDDNLAHSEWLTLMRDRLALLYQLLAPNGVMMISINDKELAYVKTLMDEIFGRDNFINNFIWKTDGNFDNQARIKVCHEYILMYAKDESLFEDPSVKDPNIPEGSKLFKEHIQNTIVKNGPKNPASEILLPEGFPTNFEEGKIEARSDKWPIYKAPIKIKDHKLTHDVVAYSGWSSKALAEEFINNGFQPVLDKKGQETIFVLSHTGSIEAIKKRSENSGYVVSVLENMGSTQKMSAELKTLGIKFDFPKPEGLIAYLLKICTEEGDLVLDCFGGSGTTFAVAQKLQRKWIGIELGNQIDRLIVPRLKHVIGGTDKIGISKVENWKGGGSFKYYHLGESIILMREDGTGDFNWNLGTRFIQESFLTSYDYIQDRDVDFREGELFADQQQHPLVGVQHIGIKKRVAVVSLNEPDGCNPTISYDELQSIYRTIKKKYSPEYINIFTNRGIEIAYDSKPDDLEVFKVPNAIFNELEK